MAGLRDQILEREAKRLFDASRDDQGRLDVALAIDHLVAARVAQGLAEQNDRVGTPDDDACGANIDRPARNAVDAARLNLRRILDLMNVSD
jgi:hypothetical protein